MSEAGGGERGAASSPEGRFEREPATSADDVAGWDQQGAADDRTRVAEAAGAVAVHDQVARAPDAAEQVAGWQDPATGPLGDRAGAIGALALHDQVAVEPGAAERVAGWDDPSDAAAQADALRQADASGRSEGDRRADLHALQGDNDLGWQSDCGVAATGEMLADAGVEVERHPVTENDAVHRASELGVANESHPDPADNGGTNALDRAELASSFGVDAPAERGLTTEQLAGLVEDDRGVIAAVDARSLWQDAGTPPSVGETNHAVWVTDTIRDERTGEVSGFVVNDTGRDDGGGAEVTVDVMRAAWEERGGTANVTTERLGDLRRGSST